MGKRSKGVSLTPAQGSSPKVDFAFKPINLEQVAACKAFNRSDITFLLGQAGCGKTHVALGLAMQEVLSGRAKHIVVTRPQVTAGEEMGFLKGDVTAKMKPWLMPLFDVLGEQSKIKPEEWLKQYVEICPIAFMRGRTFIDCVGILTEAQNCSYSQIKLFLSRLGGGSKLIVEGDTFQADRRDSGLLEVVERLSDADLDGISLCDLTTAISPRHPLLTHILAALP